jgi:hypothetical protein
MTTLTVGESAWRRRARPHCANSVPARWGYKGVTHFSPDLEPAKSGLSHLRGRLLNMEAWLVAKGAAKAVSTAKKIVDYLDEQKKLDALYASERDEFVNELHARTAKPSTSPKSPRWAC